MRWWRWPLFQPILLRSRSFSNIHRDFRFQAFRTSVGRVRRWVITNTYPLKYRHRTEAVYGFTTYQHLFTYLWRRFASVQFIPFLLNMSFSSSFHILLVLFLFFCLLSPFTVSFSLSYFFTTDFIHFVTPATFLKIFISHAVILLLSYSFKSHDSIP